MCGIVGIIGVEPVAPRMVEALRRLEYRGYDSAGVATLERGHLERRRAAVISERERFFDRLDGVPADAPPSQANFVWLRAEGMTGSELAATLERDSRLIVAPR